MSHDAPTSKSDLLNRIEAGWNDLHAFIASLNDAQLTTKTDAGGWTVKDHLIHLAVWEDSVEAMLQKQSRYERMGVDFETWRTNDWDKVNAVIYQHHQHMPLADVLTTFAQIHQRLLDKIQALSDDDLMRPYNYYQTHSSYDLPVMEAVVSGTYAHYDEHRPWMEHIAQTE